jgi:hypothetical protein
MNYISLKIYYKNINDIIKVNKNDSIIQITVNQIINFKETNPRRIQDKKGMGRP